MLVGQVLKCTPKRVIIQYKGLYLSSKGVREYYVGYRVGVPDDCLILNEGLQSTLTMEALKNRL